MTQIFTDDRANSSNIKIFDFSETYVNFLCTSFFKLQKTKVFLNLLLLLWLKNHRCIS